jgi:hypothetical protein
MPWYQVVINHSDDAMIEQLSMQRLLVPFIGMIRKRRAVGAFHDEIDVWLCLDDGGDRIYYFSPKAAEIALAGNLFRGLNARVCSKKPDLEGYRKIVFALPT